MEIVRYRYKGETSYGTYDAGVVTTPENLIGKDSIGAAAQLKSQEASTASVLSRAAGPDRSSDKAGTAVEIATVPVDKVRLLAPARPSKIIALGYNYKDLVGERETYDEPVIFLKPPSAVIGPEEVIILHEDRKVWTEVELAIVIGKTCRRVSAGKASDFILGHTIANDVTMSNYMGRDHHLARSKGWDTFCPLGPWIVTDANTSALEMRNVINGNVMQSSSTDQRILDDVNTVSFLSRFFTLEPGDIILTGTPANAENSVVRDGDRVSVSIEGLGTLSNTVRSDFVTSQKR